MKRTRLIPAWRGAPVLHASRILAARRIACSSAILTRSRMEIAPLLLDAVAPVAYFRRKKGVGSGREPGERGRIERVQTHAHGGAARS